MIIIIPFFHSHNLLKTSMSVAVKEGFEYRFKLKIDSYEKVSKVSLVLSPSFSSLNYSTCLSDMYIV